MKMQRLNNIFTLKKVIIFLTVVLALLLAFLIYRSYAKYNKVYSYNVLKNKIGDFDSNDMTLAWTLGGTVQTGAFPTKDSGYIFDSLTCQDGVTADWDSTNWGLVNINPNGQNKIKCTINFKEYPWKCKRATTLHNDGTHTYGSLGTSGTLAAGDAFDCKVSTTGDYTERFYYVADQDANTAVLIYYNNVSGGVASNSTTYAYDVGGNSWNNGPVTAIAQLPTTTQWDNISLTSTIRDIKDETGATKKANFDYGNAAARLLTTQEVVSACGITVGSHTTGELDTCTYLMENTYYQASIYKYGYWLENARSSSSYYAWVVYGSNRLVRDYDAYRDFYFGVRPAIEVLKSDIQY